MISVEYYPHGSHERETQSCETIVEAVELVRELGRVNNRGRYGHILYDDGSIVWTASLRFERLRPGARPYWSLGFPNTTIWKSRATVIGEMAGVRYASHRSGYRASERSMAKFVDRVAHWAERDKQPSWAAEETR